MTALLIIGMQVDLLPGGPAEVPDSQSLVGIINKLLPDYRLVAAANFHLPADHVMFAANHLWRRPGQTVPINGQPTLLHHIFCVPDSFGAEMIPGLKAGHAAYTALMGTNGQVPPHSAFFDAERKRDTGLADFLRSEGVNELHLCGVPLDSTVVRSALDGVALRFDVNVLMQACRAASPAKQDEALAALQQAGITIR